MRPHVHQSAPGVIAEHAEQCGRHMLRLFVGLRGTLQVGHLSGGGAVAVDEDLRRGLLLQQEAAREDGRPRQATELCGGARRAAYAGQARAGPLQQIRGLPEEVAAPVPVLLLATRR